MEKKTNDSVFKELFSVNVNDHTEKRENQGTVLTYLSWAWAWAETKKRYPDATYEIVKSESGLPYFGDPSIGYMVYTRVTIEGVTHEMWLPVMDGANRALKGEPYTIRTKFGKEINVKAVDMFDVNKTVMRCLTKNLAMFGLGLYLYAGEDLPETDESEEDKPKTAKKAVELASVSERKELFSVAKIVCGDKYADTIKGWFAEMGVKASEELTKEQVHELLDKLKAMSDAFVAEAV